MTGEPGRIAVFRALQLGDMLCAVPALRALRQRFRDARVTLIGLPWAETFAKRFSRYVDDFLPFHGHRGLPEQPPDEAAFARLVAEACERRFDLAVQLHGSGGVSNAIVRRLGALAVAGFCVGEAPAAGFLSYPDHGSEVRRLLALAAFVGAPAVDPTLEFPLFPEDEAELARFGRQRGLPTSSCICLHPGARSANKRWPPGNFAAVGDELHLSSRLPVVITGSAAEQPLTAAVTSAMRSPAADAAGPISVGALAAQIARASVLVTNDTGVSHIAAALGVPSVVVFMATDLERWAPLDRRLHRPVWDPQCRRIRDVIDEAAALLHAPAIAPAPSPSLLQG